MVWAEQEEKRSDLVCHASANLISIWDFVALNEQGFSIGLSQC